ncbi:hypothetical protein AJ80_07147 [Polytolypa hystricis UAMH7299]|uniref:Uncharacterized protein n=1 Tax=Polytolypa hystricis (strain UAMH7299) TaxID=1447883 RepID=A0A2B7XQA0_POLH7|nr:hypothetical protein AJ80_07147 [Polytolypa hystricis UAMH7299]
MGSKLDMAIPSAESIGNDIGGTLGYYLDAIISWVSDKASDALEGVSKWAMESIPQYASAVGDWATENIPRYASAVSNWVVSGFETFGQWLGQPNVYPLLIAFAISFTLITMLLLCLGFGPAGILPGSLAAAFQSWMYGGFTPAGGLFATCTSIAMLGLVMPAVVGVAVVLAGLITFVAWECGLGR